MQKDESVRTAEEIVEFYKEHQKNDMFGFMAEVLVPYLSAEQAKPFIREEFLPKWTAQPLTRDFITAEMKKYMEFAWGKATDHRGISAGRSINKMSCWLWLLKDDETYKFAAKTKNYPQYGAPILKYICEKYGFPIPQTEEAERMAKGLPCRKDCDEGCGK